MPKTLNKIGVPPPSIGLISGGACWHELPWKDIIVEYDVLDTYKISRRPQRRRRLDLGKYDIVIVPWAPDQSFLRRNSREIERFLEDGGILLAFGEFDENWVPRTHWTFMLNNNVKILNANEKVFTGLSEALVSDWNDSSHGWFSGLPENSIVLAEAELSDGTRRPIAFVDKVSFRGQMLIMTLDPDFHTYTGVPAAKVLLQNCLNWAITAYFNGNPEVRHRSKQLHKLLSFAVFSFAELIIVIITGLIAFFLLKLLPPH